MKPIENISHLPTGEGMRFPILLAADLHGVERHYELLAAYAQYAKPKAIIIAGDITPSVDDCIVPSVQRTFLEHRLIPLLAPIKDHDPATGIYLILGNDDCSSNNDLFEKPNEVYTAIHGRRVPLNSDFDIAGYSFVPITPFDVKDFEKFDLSTVDDRVRPAYERLMKQWKLKGSRSSASGFEEVLLSPEMGAIDSIQHDLMSELYAKSPDRTIYVIHSPPHGSALDVTLNKDREKIHVGSIAVREFIERRQPYITVHGHIHETVRLTGAIGQQIGNALCMTPGHEYQTECIAAALFDLYEPMNATRIIIR